MILKLEVRGFLHFFTYDGEEKILVQPHVSAEKLFFKKQYYRFRQEFFFFFKPMNKCISYEYLVLTPIKRPYTYIFKR